MKKIFNPLFDSVTSKTQVSTSALYNAEVGVCPKCKQNMGTATIEEGVEVFYCDTCRVSSPLPNK